MSPITLSAATIYSTRDRDGVKAHQLPLPLGPKGGYRLLAEALDQIEALPAVQDFLDSIVNSRRNTRPGYPPVAMFRAFCTKYLLAERFTVGLIERLRSSPKLREVCGLDSIPSESTFSRFFNRLADLPDPDALLAQMVGKLRELLPGLGQDVAVDSTDIEAYANPNRTVVRDTEATWGRRTTKSSSNSKEKTEPFFGYKMHALNDAVHGVPLVHIVHPANQNDSPELPRLVEKAQAMFGWLAPDHLLADRGYDSQANHKFLVSRGIAPIIHVRKPTAHDGLHDGLYDRNGFPVCGDGKTRMDYIRTDPTTGHHLFRCPPEGCALKAKSTGAMRYCDIPDYWLDPQDNFRAVGVVARASPEWKELYARRQVIERMFGSMKRSRLLNRHQYMARRKLETHVTMSVLTYLATMLARVLAGDVDRVRRMRIGVG
ncbi:MAG: transposase [Dehalococcoidia bacterium]|nr:transposase [Dehalococcoidia bacterium]